MAGEFGAESCCQSSGTDVITKCISKVLSRLVCKPLIISPMWGGNFPCSGWLQAPAHVMWVGGWRKQACENGRGLPHGGCTHVCIHTVAEWPAAPLWRRPSEEQKAPFSWAELSVTNSSLGGDERWSSCHTVQWKHLIKTDSLYLFRLYVQSPPLFQVHSL